MSFATKEQLKDIVKYISDNISVPTIGIGGGYAPIGTIISYMGLTAPQDYLICDGSTHNIADYPELARFFAAQFGTANYFGGDGSTTFATPDLRGEFLRGSGSNSHADQGSGANVGTHQDATSVITFDVSQSNTRLYGYSTSKNDNTTPENPDSYITGNGYVRVDGSYVANTQQMAKHTTRPTNTSVLYCIKAVNAGEVYSETERVVGTWIDGRPVYQKTFILSTPVTFTSKTWKTFFSINDLNADNLINSIVGRYSSGLSSQPGINNGQMTRINNGNIQLYTLVDMSDLDMATIQYTKTTDLTGGA